MCDLSDEIIIFITKSEIYCREFVISKKLYVKFDRSVNPIIHFKINLSPFDTKKKIDRLRWSRMHLSFFFIQVRADIYFEWKLLNCRI
jgi:hypothetical protein